MGQEMYSSTAFLSFDKSDPLKVISEKKLLVSLRNGKKKPKNVKHLNGPLRFFGTSRPLQLKERKNGIKK